ncbi:MAG: RluA family pseudouridine synthase [Pseudomonadota bacterium]
MQELDSTEPRKPAVQQKKVEAADADMRLDRWFKTHYPQVKHSSLEKYLRKGQVRVNGRRVKAACRVQPGDVIRVPPLDIDAKMAVSDKARGRNNLSKEKHRDAAKHIRDITLYEDDALLVLNKPFGIPVQGGLKTKRHIDEMLEALSGDREKPRLVHRLDRDTGGVLVLAKSRSAAASLGRDFQKRLIEKTYWALTLSRPKPSEGTIDLPIEKRVRSGDDREVMMPSSGGKRAITHFKTLEASTTGPAFVALQPVTGRTHQLRVHCAAMGTPIVGDLKYGGRGASIDGISTRLHLFCRQLSLRHPVTGNLIELRAELTDHMEETWKFFAFDNDASVTWPTK